MTEHPPVIVHPPTPSGGRRVTVHGQIVGLAHGRGDVAEFLRRAGVAEPAEDIALDDPRLVEWRGGNLDDWPMPSA
ncbi:hypothetical protein ACWIG3_00480 [Streptomyces celluloflavus]|uniref:Uncharacterized protein n=2 Tax=Streptomyces TaxID=1883 RepID=A0A4Q9HXH4_STRKA|nr:MULTISPECIES: hypothetical protein [Streptomyces]MYU54732.1 hypothetical protein [Streptomyces sp. SID7805]TBO59906.1 hypothetical protein EYS09_09515 [Streptomyces kasugaensis]WSK10588.1 hypothetical protein OG717_01750 [Streptomyces celluloflavus]